MLFLRFVLENSLRIFTVSVCVKGEGALTCQTWKALEVLALDLKSGAQSFDLTGSTQSKCSRILMNEPLNL